MLEVNRPFRKNGKWWNTSEEHYMNLTANHYLRPGHSRLNKHLWLLVVWVFSQLNLSWHCLFPHLPFNCMKTKFFVGSVLVWVLLLLKISGKDKVIYPILQGTLGYKVQLFSPHNKPIRAGFLFFLNWDMGKWGWVGLNLTFQYLNWNSFHQSVYCLLSVCVH